MLKNLFIFAVLLVGTALLTLALDHGGAPSKPTIIKIPPEPVKMAQEVPDFSFTDIQGRTHSIRDFQGKIVILNFWASWCTPCVKEFPLLLEAAKNHPDKVALIALSSDFTAEAMEGFIDKKIPESRDMENVFIALDVEAKITADLFQTIRLPETIIIDSRGQMREKLVGANWGMAEMEEILQKYSD